MDAFRGSPGFLCSDKASHLKLHFSPMFGFIARTVTRHGWAVLLVGGALFAFLAWISPPWSSVSRDDDVRFFPADYPSVVGRGLLERGFPADLSDSTVVILVEREDDLLSRPDLSFADRLTRVVSKLMDEQPDLAIKSVIDRHKPVIGERLLVKGPDGGQLALIGIKLNSTFISKQARITVGKILELVENYAARAPEGLKVGLTGSAVVGHDSNVASNKSIEATTTATISLVIAILLIVYRSPMLALIPLVTIALSVWASLNLIALLANPPVNFQVINITQIFVVVILYGAGTDYCLFLIARYREELARGLGRVEALQHAIGQVGGALVASAGTVILGLGMLWFSTFAKVRYSGPAIALSLAIGLVASLTLAPVLLNLLRGAVFWPLRPPHHVPGHDRDQESLRETPMFGFWARISDFVVSRPGTILAASLAIMAPFAWWGTQTKSSYDMLADLSRESPSVVGSELFRKYFPAGEIGPSTVLIDAPGVDFRTDAGRETIGRLSQALAAVPNISEVRSLTRPLGKPGQYGPPEPGTEAVADSASGSKPGGFLSGLTLENAQQQIIRSGILTQYVSTKPEDEADKGRITRMDLVFSMSPFSEQGLETLEAVDQEMRKQTQSAGLLPGATYGFAGPTVQVNDLKRVTLSDQRRMYVLVTLGVYGILVVLLRRPGICLYLIFTVLLGYLATLGLADLLFRALTPAGVIYEGLDWKVSFFLFVILVAVGEDYNIFLMSRVIEEERHYGPIEGTRRAVAHTGGIISSCGVIMAGTFLALMFGSLNTLKQLGFALGFGVLLDTFIVRPILVPAFVVLWHRMRPGARLDSVITQPEHQDNGGPKVASEPKHPGQPVPVVPTRFGHRRSAPAR